MRSRVPRVRVADRSCEVVSPMLDTTASKCHRRRTSRKLLLVYLATKHKIGVSNAVIQVEPFTKYCTVVLQPLMM